MGHLLSAPMMRPETTATQRHRGPLSQGADVL